jgi:hypothetical protein
LGLSAPHLSPEAENQHQLRIVGNAQPGGGKIKVRGTFFTSKLIRMFASKAPNLYFYAPEFHPFFPSAKPAKTRNFQKNAHS